MDAPYFMLIEVVVFEQYVGGGGAVVFSEHWVTGRWIKLSNEGRTSHGLHKAIMEVLCTRHTHWGNKICIQHFCQETLGKRSVEDQCATPEANVKITIWGGRTCCTGWANSPCVPPRSLVNLYLWFNKYHTHALCGVCDFCNALLRPWVPLPKLIASKSFRTDRLEWELQMVQLSATSCSCIAIPGALYLGVKRPGREADHSPPRSNNAWSYTSTPQYAFMAWCLVKHRNNFTFTLPLFCESIW
jgi:hypothetical protein